MFQQRIRGATAATLNANDMVLRWGIGSNAGQENGKCSSEDLAWGIYDI